jgi:hypothetical protein
MNDSMQKAMSLDVFSVAPVLRTRSLDDKLMTLLHSLHTAPKHSRARSSPPAVVIKIVSKIPFGKWLTSRTTGGPSLIQFLCSSSCHFIDTPGLAKSREDLRSYFLRPPAIRRRTPKLLNGPQIVETCHEWSLLLDLVWNLITS